VSIGCEGSALEGTKEACCVVEFEILGYRRSSGHKN
jgi:hypothetical protein